MDDAARYSWAHLNHLQVGRLAEHLTVLELVGAGVDVFSSEVDNRGIDLIARLNDRQYVDVQVKSIRWGSSNYVFARKSTFVPRENLMLALVLFMEGEPPRLFLIPSLRWKQEDKLFRSRDFHGKPSEPEWGLDLTKPRLVELLPFACPEAARRLARGEMFRSPQVMA